MNPPPQSRREWFEAALEQPEALRRAFLDRHCADAGMREAVSALLEAHVGENDDAIERSLANAVETLAEARPAPEAAELVGSEVGGYVLTRVLGQGGSSVVFCGERSDGAVRQRVAIKLFRRALLTADERARFTRERMALARLTHPAIARQLDGGITPNGLPYIALELVDGERLLDYARSARLAVRARLALMIDVCRAVEAAHRALIVHRDLKPSNVLVTREGHVKLVDFGIAKFLDEEADSTRTGHHALTPAYAAPEQFARGQITTATDVYALGVLLGELLVGLRLSGDTTSTPSALITVDMEAALPAPPRILRRLMRGDLDNVVLKAIAPEPERRYPSAAELAADLRRYLDLQPVSAHPPSRWYRARKFAQRHAGGVLVSAVALLAIVASLGVALWSAKQARDEARRATVVSNFMGSVFTAAEAELPRDQRPRIEDLISAATRRLAVDDTLGDRARIDLELALARVGLSVGDEASTKALLGSAGTLVARTYEADDAPAIELASLRAGLALRDNAAQVALGLLEPQRDALLARLDERAVEALLRLAQAYNDVGRNDDSQATLDALRRALEGDPDAAPATVLSVLIHEANFHTANHRFALGLERGERALRYWRQTGSPADARTLWLYEAIANAASSMGDQLRAEAAYRDALALAARIYDKPHPMVAWLTGLYGSFLVGQGRYADAEEYVSRGLDMRIALHGEDAPETIFALAAMGRLRGSQRRMDEALAYADRGVASCLRTQLAHNACTGVLLFRAQLHGIAARFGAAKADLDAALVVQRKISRDDDPQMARIWGTIAEIEEKQAHHVAALAAADRALAIERSAGGGYWADEMMAQYWRASALFGLGRNAEALAAILDLEPRFAAAAPTNTRRYGMLALKARALDAAGRYAEAAVAARGALALERKPTVPDPALRAELERLSSAER